MIRVVALRKAAVAGAAGALAWELATRAAILAGIPLFDMVHELGTLAYPRGEPVEWWFAGLAAHVSVGIAWALLYGYFFWARLRVPPPVQGLIFACLPAILAILLVVPQVRLMHLEAEIVRLRWSLPFEMLSWEGAAGLLAGHAIFGLVAGALYTHPAGYRTGSRPRGAGFSPARRPSKPRLAKTNPAAFIFATGLECSYPTIENGRWRRDQMYATGHYGRWQQDFALAREIGITHIRYGPPLHLILTGPGRYDWSLADEPMAELCDAGPEPIVDLCHFGLPDWLGSFKNPEIAHALGEYAGAFAARYPGVRFFTPVNEMYVCARFSGLIGAWNEQRRDESSFVTAAFNLAKASVAMSDAILAVQPEAVFVNSESSEFTQPCCPDPEIQSIAEFENERRFLPLDLIYAHEVSDTMFTYLKEHGRVEDYRRFMGRKSPRRTILGVDYYEWNERLLDTSGEARSLGELFGWYVIASQYYDRYGLTMMHTETNGLEAGDAPRWLWRQWHNVQLLRRAGVPLVGFTWYSLTDQIDWEIGLTRASGTVDPVGLVDLNRDPRPVGLSYRHLIEMHRDQPGYRECPALMKVLS